MIRALKFAAIVLVLALAVSLCSRGVDPALKRICASGYGSDEQCGRVQP